MKKFKFYLLALSLGLFVMLNGCSKDEATVDEESVKLEIIKLDNSLTRAGNNPSASGQAELNLGDGIERHFAFQVRTNKNGNVKGSGQLTHSDGQLQVKFDLDCIQTTPANLGLVAFISGSVTSSSNENLVGLDCFFYVVDGGEEDDLNPDIRSLVLVGEDLMECSEDINEVFSWAVGNIPWYYITGGNVQVND